MREMDLALEEMLLDIRRITRVMIFQQFLVLGGMKQARQVRAFQSNRVGVEKGGERGVDLDDGPCPVSQKHGLARSFPNRAELHFRLQQFLVGAMPAGNVDPGGGVMLAVVSLNQLGNVGERDQTYLARFSNPFILKSGGLPLSLIHISEPTRQAESSYAVFCLN